VPDSSTTEVFTSRAQAQSALRSTLLQASTAGTKEMIWLDPDFSLWPLSDAEVLEALRNWASVRSRCLLMLAQDYERVMRMHPRFVSWRRMYGHLVVAKQYNGDEAGAPGTAGQVVSLLLGSTPLMWCLWNWGVGRGSMGEGLRSFTEARLWIDAITQRSTDSFAASTLGL